MVYSINPKTGIYKAFTATSADVGVTLTSNGRYMVLTDSAVMIAQGTTASPPTAALASGNALVFPGVPLIVDGRNGDKLAARQAGATGGQLTIVQLMD